MVGASHKSRSLEKIWRISIRTTPRSRGEDFKTQNEKNKSEHIAFRNCRIYRKSRDGWREKICLHEIHYSCMKPTGWYIQTLVGLGWIRGV